MASPANCEALYLLRLLGLVPIVTNANNKGSLYFYSL